MSRRTSTNRLDRRTFLKLSAAGLSSIVINPFRGLGREAAGAVGPNPVYGVNEIPDLPFAFPESPDYHAGLETLLYLMERSKLSFYRSPDLGVLKGPEGLIAADDIVLIKVNAQWKYRGCTNSDLIRGLVRRILDHPDGYSGEVVIFENGQGRGSLACDTSASYDGDTGVQANANDQSHSFLYLVNTLFKDTRVSAQLNDTIRSTFIDADDHLTDGFRLYENVSYPCFTTAGGHRVELREGIWNGSGHSPNLKLINVPVLKHHDQGGSEITASLKHFYGVLSMADGNSGIRHYGRLGETTGKMAASVRTPVLNIVDAIWVSYLSLKGYPTATTFRANQVAASQDPVALDYWAAKNILYPINNDERHHPTYAGIDAWLTQARDTINAAGGLSDPASGIKVGLVTKDEAEMRVLSDSAARFLEEGPLHFRHEPRVPRSNEWTGRRPPSK
jgi:hypothetical protein